MKNAAVPSGEFEDDLNLQPNLLLDTLVATHYLAMQMRMLAADETFSGRKATGFLSKALSEWARLVEDDLFDDDLPESQASPQGGVDHEVREAVSRPAGVA